jgi:hypothetical protein
VLQQHKKGEEHIILGDFNLHRPCWGGCGLRNTHPEADTLLAIAGEHQTQFLLLSGTIARQERGQATTIDLVFATHMLSEGAITCGLAGWFLDHDLDHLAISTIFEVAMATRYPTPRRMWKLTDETVLLQKLEQSLLLPGILETPNGLDAAVESLIVAINAAIEAATPLSRPCHRSQSGWTPEIKEAQMQARRLRRQYQRYRRDVAWEAYRKARNLKGRLIRKALQGHTENVYKKPPPPLKDYGKLLGGHATDTLNELKCHH